MISSRSRAVEARAGCGRRRRRSRRPSRPARPCAPERPLRPARRRAPPGVPALVPAARRLAISSSLTAFSRWRILYPNGAGATFRPCPPMISLRRIHHVCLRVEDLEAAAARWSIQFGLSRRPDRDGRAYLACDYEPYSLELVQRGGSGPRPHRLRARAGHHARGRCRPLRRPRHRTSPRGRGAAPPRPRRARDRARRLSNRAEDPRPAGRAAAPPRCRAFTRASSATSTR